MLDMALKLRKDRTGCCSSSQKLPASCLPARSRIYSKCDIFSFLAQHLKVEHDYIFLLNTTVHRFIGRKGVGGVAIARNSMKLHYGLVSAPFALPPPPRRSQWKPGNPFNPLISSPLLSTWENKAPSPHQARWKEALSSLKCFQISETKRGRRGEMRGRVLCV